MSTVLVLPATRATPTPSKRNNNNDDTFCVRRYADGVRGVHTTKPIPAMVQLMGVPKHLLITDLAARTTEHGQRLLEVEPELSVPNHCQARRCFMPCCACLLLFLRFPMVSRCPFAALPLGATG